MTYFSSIFFKKKPKKRGKLFSTRDTTSLLEEGSGSSVPRWMPVVCHPWTRELISGEGPVMGNGSPGKLGEPFSSRIGIFGGVFQRLSSLVRLWSQTASQAHLGIPWSVQWRNVLFSRSYSRVCCQSPPHSLSLINETVKVLLMKSQRKRDFFVSLGWEFSVELTLKTGMTFHLSCLRFGINFTKFWWEESGCGQAQVEMPGCPGAEASDCISYLDLFCQTHPQVANVQKNPKPFHVIWQAATQGSWLSWFINLEWLWIDHTEVQGFVSCCQSLGLQRIPKYILVLRTKPFPATHR